MEIYDYTVKNNLPSLALKIYICFCYFIARRKFIKSIKYENMSFNLNTIYLILFLIVEQYDFSEIIKINFIKFICVK